ncbi:MAG TPA: hypothetical protein VF682_19695 [Pseudomonas sp.]|jgi:hypothetical protein
MYKKFNVEESRAAIANCDLGVCPAVDHVDGLMRSSSPSVVTEKDPEAVVAGSTIVSIVAGMSEENRQAVKDSVLLATLAADKKYKNSNDDAVEWYGEFIAFLKHCGWLPQVSAFSDYRANTTHFTMEQEGLKILASAIAAMALPNPTTGEVLLKVAQDAIAVLQASEGPLELFERSSKSKKGAKFAIASAVQSADGELVTAMGAVNFTASHDVTNVLFWEWENTAVRIKQVENHMLFNMRQYNDVKADIQAALTDRARSALQAFRID